MKDYDSIILWLDYYNKGLSREKGRKISKSLSVYDPLINELIEAASSLGYIINKEQVNDSARYPCRPHIKSGYVMLPKNDMVKNKVLKNIAEKMLSNRSKSKIK